MKISNSQKKEIIMDTFELLRNNYADNSNALEDCIMQMSQIDFKLSVEMWKALILDYPDIHHSSGYFAFGIMFHIECTIGEGAIYEILVSDGELRKAIYGEAGELTNTPLYAIRHFISVNNLEIANEMLQLMDENRYLTTSWYDILDDVIPDKNIGLSENAFDLLYMWIQKVNDREERAKLNLKMLKFM